MGGTTGGPLQSITPLRIAAQSGHLNVICELIKHDGIDLDKPGDSGGGFESPLQTARGRECDEIVEVLLAAGAKDDAAAAVEG